MIKSKKITINLILSLVVSILLVCALSIGTTGAWFKANKNYSGLMTTSQGIFYTAGATSETFSKEISLKEYTNSVATANLDSNDFMTTGGAFAIVPIYLKVASGDSVYVRARVKCVITLTGTDGGTNTFDGDYDIGTFDGRSDVTDALGSYLTLSHLMDATNTFYINNDFTYNSDYKYFTNTSSQLQSVSGTDKISILETSVGAYIEGISNVAYSYLKMASMFPAEITAINMSILVETIDVDYRETAGWPTDENLFPA